MSTEVSILVIDDEPKNLDVIETLLDGEGYQINYAANGHQALNSLDIFKPDVILMDVMMPEINGIDLCKRIKAESKWQAIPIIMVTALTRKEDLADCLKAGADDFISKPVNGIELRSRVHSMLRIKQQHDKLEALLNAREDMVKSIVHDLRNPLSGILLSTHMLKSGKLSPEKQQQKIEQIVMNGERMQSLIDNLLIAAKLESGKMLLNYTEVDLGELCQSALSGFEAIISKKNIHFVTDLPEIGGIIKIDGGIFRRVLDNLLANAIKFSPPNMPVTLRAEYLPEGGAKVQVADLGPGVPELLRKTIFEKYEIGNLMPGVSQIGLGLAFCKMAVEAHQGMITVEDNEPEGSIFTVLV